MASFVDSVRTVMGCKNVVFKLLIVSSLLSYPLFQMSTAFKGWTDMWSILTIVALIFYTGYLMIASSNLINERTELFVTFFNPIKIFLVGIGGLVSSLPMIIVMNYVGFYLYGLFMSKGLAMQAVIGAVVVAEIILLGILAVQMMLYAYKYNPLHAYNVLKILKAFPDFALKSIAAIIGMAIVAVLMGTFGYVVYMMFGYGLILFMVVSFFVTMLLAYLLNYYAQMFMESVVLYRRVNYEENANDVLDHDLLINKEAKDDKDGKKKKKSKRK